MSAAVPEEATNKSGFPEAKEICFASEANELFFGVVGHVGSGTGFIARKLKELIVAEGYEAEVIKASAAIRDWASKNDHVENPPSTEGRVEIWKTERMQTLGDEMRKGANTEKDTDFAAVAQGVISLVRDRRAAWNGGDAINGEAVHPEPSKRRAYIIESIRHPAEVNLLRLVYGDAFSLVGVVCHEDVRELRLLSKYFEREDRSSATSLEAVQGLMERDAEDKDNKNGQHVADAFWESDYFIDNSPDELKDPGEFTSNEDLGRLIDIITHSKIVRPTIAETGMHVAVSAQIRSSCLSRQVGAAIVDNEGNVLAIGANEVPKAGGGIYGEAYEEDDDDRRCNACEDPHCSSNVEQNELIDKLILAFPSIKGEGDAEASDDLVKKIRKVGLGGILEFSRAIHAEMDALTTAARKGISVKGAWMFVTTFPCHYCARHLVAAGIDQVQYIEPYPKSRALALHGDSITNKVANWAAPSVPKSDGNNAIAVDDDPKYRRVGDPEFGQDTNMHKVLFRPFSGVAPRLYHRAFTKDRPLKNKLSGERDIGEPEWGGKWGVRMIPYTDLEARLTEEEAQ